MEYEKEIRVIKGTINGYRYFYDRDHPLANASGIVYLHRHVASLKIGRWLRRGEVVHHLDGDKGNNDPDNLVVCKSFREHNHIHQPPRRRVACRVCGKKTRNRLYCSNKCRGFDERKVERPPKKQLQREMEKLCWTALGEKYGVSDNAVRKWARGYGFL